MTNLKDLRKFYTTVIEEKREHIAGCTRNGAFKECAAVVCKCKAEVGIIPRGKAFMRICKIEDKDELKGK